MFGNTSSKDEKKKKNKDNAVVRRFFRCQNKSCCGGGRWKIGSLRLLRLTQIYRNTLKIFRELKIQDFT